MKKTNLLLTAIFWLLFILVSYQVSDEPTVWLIAVYGTMAAISFIAGIFTEDK